MSIKAVDSRFQQEVDNRHYLLGGDRNKVAEAVRGDISTASRVVQGDPEAWLAKFSSIAQDQIRFVIATENLPFKVAVVTVFKEIDSFHQEVHNRYSLFGGDINEVALQLLDDISKANNQAKLGEFSPIAQDQIKFAIATENLPLEAAVAKVFKLPSKLQLTLEIRDIFSHTMCYLSLREILRATGVCRTWLASLNHEEVIRPLHQAKLPHLAAGMKYNFRNFVAVATTGPDTYLTLFNKYLGEPIFNQPISVSQRQLELLCQDDPDSPGKKRYETFRAVIIPNAVKRIFGKEELAYLDKKNRLTVESQAPNDVDTKENTFTIPSSICNAIELFIHPKESQENNPVFTYVCQEVREQCTACVENPSIVFVRREVPEDSRNKTWEAQQTRLASTPLAGLLELIIPCGLDILETGTCSYLPTDTTDIHFAIFACTSDTIVINGRAYPLILEGFAPNAGVNAYVDTYESFGYARDYIGAIPVITA